MILKAVTETRLMYDNEPEALIKYKDVKHIENCISHRAYKDYSSELERWVFVIEYKTIEYDKTLRGVN